MRFDSKEDAKNYLDGVGKDLFGNVIEGFNEIELETMNKQSLYEMGRGVENPKMEKEIIHKMVRDGAYWYYYMNVRGVWKKV